jgi:hypothetical protein
MISVQALPFSDGLKLLSYFKDWTSNPDKVGTNRLPVLHTEVVEFRGFCLHLLNGM